MANRYYLVDITGASATKLAALQSRMPAVAARNCNAYHVRLSVDTPPSRALVQGDTTNQQHNQITSQSYVLQFWAGDMGGANTADPALYAYLAANAAIWERGNA